MANVTEKRTFGLLAGNPGTIVTFGIRMSQISVNRGVIVTATHRLALDPLPDFPDSLPDFPDSLAGLQYFLAGITDPLMGLKDPLAGLQTLFLATQSL